MCSNIRGILRVIDPSCGGLGGAPNGVGVRISYLSLPAEPTLACEGYPLEVGFVGVLP